MKKIHLSILITFLSFQLFSQVKQVKEKFKKMDDASIQVNPASENFSISLYEGNRGHAYIALQEKTSPQHFVTRDSVILVFNKSFTYCYNLCSVEVPNSFVAICKSAKTERLEIVSFYYIDIDKKKLVKKDGKGITCGNESFYSGGMD